MSKQPDRKTVAPMKTNSEKHVGAALFLAALLVHVGLTIWLSFTQDDAFITFRYAANFINGEGLVYNSGERIEGYTNFLWLLFTILGRLGGLELVLFSKILGIVCGLGTITILYLLAGDIFGRDSIWRGICCLLLGSMYSFAYWTISGLETAAFSLAVLASMYFYLRHSYLTAPLAVLATLLRPEGAIVFAFIFIYEIITTRSLSRFACISGVAYLSTLLPYAAFKFLYFGGLLPNPFYAKTDFAVSRLAEGMGYAALYFWHYLGAGLFLVPAIMAPGKYKRTLGSIGVFVILYTLYIIFIGGDVLKVHRFFVPLMPLFALVVVIGISCLTDRKWLITMSVIIVFGWQMWLPYKHVNTFHFAEIRLAAKNAKLADDVLAVDKTDFSFATTTIGIIGYRLLGHTVIDMLGLTDSTIARHPEPWIEGMETTWKERHFNTPYLLSRQPDYILFSTGQKPSAPAERALFLYSQFLNNYRTVAFEFESYRHDVFKRYFPIKRPIARDVSPAFIRFYWQGLDKRSRNDYSGALADFTESLKYLPRQTFSYIHYYIAESLRETREYEKSYAMLKKLCDLDTLTYEVYQDLFVIESSIMKNKEKAAFYRSRMASLMPWYLPRLDSVAARRR